VKEYPKSFILKAKSVNAVIIETFFEKSFFKSKKNIKRHKMEDRKGITLKEYSKSGIKSVKNLVNRRNKGGAACAKSSGAKYPRTFLSNKLKAKEASSPYKSGMFKNRQILNIRAINPIESKSIFILFSKKLFNIRF